MIFKDLTLQQFCSLDYGRNIVVTAGPGAGKTKVLSHRFCFILLTDDSVSLSQILTLTFTEKAAEEMKGRIYEMINRLERNVNQKGNEIIQKRIRDVKEQFQRNSISTIHAFCAKLLREYPVESGVDPGFNVIQGAKQRRIMQEAVETGVSTVWQDQKDDLIELLRVFGNRKNLIIALQNIIEHPLTLDRVIQTKERLFGIKNWDKQVFRDYCRFIADHHLLPYLHGLRGKQNKRGPYEELISLLEDWHTRIKKEQDYFGVPELFGHLRSLVADRKASQTKLSVVDGLKTTSYVDLVEEFYPDLYLTQSPDLIFSRQLDFFLKTAVMCKNIYQKKKEQMGGLDFADLETYSYTLLMNLDKASNHHGIQRIRNRFKYIMVDEFQDTNQVQWDIIRTLSSNKDQTGDHHLQPGKLFVVGDKRQAIYRFRGGDVTVFQSVTEEIKSSNPDNPSLSFWQDHQVNDLMERIDSGYSELVSENMHAFESLPKTEKENIRRGDIYLPHNFRTDSRPIAFLNTIFEDIFSNKGEGKLERFETAPKPIRMPDNKKPNSDESGSVTAYLMPTSHMGGSKAESEASLLVDIIESLLGRHGQETWEYRQYVDIREKIEKNQLAIGILFFAFSRIKTFESLFREASLPFSVHRGKGFFKCQEVMEMVQLLKYLSDQRETISLLSILRSPIFGMTDPEVFDLFYGRDVKIEHLLDSNNPFMRGAGEQIRLWRVLSHRLTLSELIRKVIADRSLTAIYSVHPNGRQRLANIEKLLEVARGFQAEGNGSLLEFVTHCLQIAEEDDEEGEALIASEADSPICLMTVHAAKGLEFPMVIIPELAYSIPFRLSPGKPLRLYTSEEIDPLVWNFMEGEIPVWSTEIPKLDYMKRKGPLNYLLTRRNRLEDMAERKRVFYVACTRTMNHLLLLGSVNQRMMEKENRPLSSEDYRERATIMDLLNDHYGFAAHFPSEESSIFKGHGESPSIIWREMKPRPFQGILFSEKRVKVSDFGKYDLRIKEIDLTESIQSPPHLQISFQSLHSFRQCPLRFYFRTVLGLRGESMDDPSMSTDSLYSGGKGLYEVTDKEYASQEALLLGNIIHRYLEGHRFGDPLNEVRFQNIWQSVSQKYAEGKGFEKGVSTLIAKKALDQIQTTIHDRDLLTLLEGQTDYREVPFLFHIEQGCYFRGIIDRLFRNKGKDHWTIIDWKSNDLTNRDPFQVIEENDYHLQLACYGWAVEEILNEKVEDRYIYFTGSGKLIRPQWDGYPKEIIKNMVRYVRGDDNTGRLWMNQIMIEKSNSGECLTCEYGKGPCGPILS